MQLREMQMKRLIPAAMTLLTACTAPDAFAPIAPASAERGTMINSTCTLTLAPVGGGNSMITWPFTATGACGRVVEVMAFPAAGYTFTNWTATDGSASTAQRWRFTITHDVRVDPVFIAPPSPGAVRLVLNDSTVLADRPGVILTLVSDAGAAYCNVEGLSPTNFSWHWGVVVGRAGDSWIPRAKGYKKGTYDFHALCYDSSNSLIGSTNVVLTVA